MAKILVTGTPGTGKTTFCSKFLKERSNYKYINTSEYIKDRRLYEMYSQKYESYEYDVDTVVFALMNELKINKDIIIDTHDPELVDFMEFDIIILIVCNTEELGSRYDQRGYGVDKISENLDAERFNEIEFILEELYEGKKFLYFKVNGGTTQHDEVEMSVDKLLSELKEVV